jgi:Putative prokaryotic signal transducing protein
VTNPDETAPRPAGPAVRWVEVATFHREEEARLLCGRLQAEGIEAQVYPEFQGGYYGESVTIPVQVLVPEHREAEARRVIERLRQP